MILNYIQISFGNIPTRHCKDIYKKPFPVPNRERKTYRVRRTYRSLEILLLYLNALDTIYLV